MSWLLGNTRGVVYDICNIESASVQHSKETVITGHSPQEGSSIWILQLQPL